MRMRAFGVVLALLAGGCGDDGSNSGEDMTVVGDMAVPDLATAASAARGEELVKHVLFCGNCHTTPDANGDPSTDPKDFLAGGKAFTVTQPNDGGTVTVYASNLTPDDATGTGTWTSSQIADAVVVGVDDEGLPLWTTMPYQRFAAMTRDDAESIGLYIKSLTPRNHAVAEPTARPTMAGTPFDYTTIPHTTLAATDPAFASAERGRYLANLACLNCHSPSGGAPAGVDVAKAYAGGRSFGGGLKSANLTPDATGLGGWTIAEIVATLKTNQEKGTGVMLLPPMPGGADGLGGISDPELNDLAEYLHTLPPVVNGPFGHPDM